MRKEEELYIELQLSKILELYFEACCSVDRLENIIFEDKVKEKINKKIANYAEELKISENEIREYLISIYTAKCSSENYIKEGTELISILKESKEEKEEEKSEEETR